MLGFSIKDKVIAGLAPKNNKLYCLLKSEGETPSIFLKTG
jgi:hypothetical protein